MPSADYLKKLAQRAHRVAPEIFPEIDHSRSLAAYQEFVARIHGYPNAHAAFTRPEAPGVHDDVAQANWTEEQLAAFFGPDGQPAFNEVLWHVDFYAMLGAAQMFSELRGSAPTKDAILREAADKLRRALFVMAHYDQQLDIADVLLSSSEASEVDCQRIDQLIHSTIDRTFPARAKLADIFMPVFAEIGKAAGVETLGEAADLCLQPGKDWTKNLPMRRRPQNAQEARMFTELVARRSRKTPRGALALLDPEGSSDDSTDRP